MAVRGVGGRFPDFLLIGAPKAGTSALHAALVQHPGLGLSKPKEPKYFMCGNAPPPLYVGPGDAHSRREWVWRQSDYTRLFDRFPTETRVGESTPFYLYDLEAQRRIAAAVPDVKLVVVLRDPVDRAYSNWMHLWVDGLEPIADVVQAFELEQSRVDAGWNPFWRYAGLGQYGHQLEHLFELFDRDQVLVLRYRELIDDPAATLDRVCAFIGVEEGVINSIPRDNSRPFVRDDIRTRLYARTLRAGAWLGQHAPPHVWRKASSPVLSALHRKGEVQRPRLSPEQRVALLEYFRADIALLNSVTGDNYDDWLETMGRGGFAERAAERAASGNDDGAEVVRAIGA